MKPSQHLVCYIFYSSVISNLFSVPFFLVFFYPFTAKGEFDYTKEMFKLLKRVHFLVNET